MSLVYNTTKNTTIELINVGDGLMYIDPTTQKNNILVKLTDTAYYNINTGKTENLVELSKSGGGAKTLNLVSVGGATYDSDYIYTNDGSLKYFETPNKIVYDMTDDFTIKVKFLIENTNNNGVFRAYDLNVWNGEMSLYSDNSFRLFVLATQIFYGNITNNIWVNLLIENIKNENKVLVYMKDENGYIYKDNYITYSSSTDLTGKYKFGNFNDTYKLNGKIDFKETDIIINGQSVLWV